MRGLLHFHCSELSSRKYTCEGKQRKGGRREGGKRRGKEVRSLLQSMQCSDLSSAESLINHGEIVKTRSIKRSRATTQHNTTQHMLLL
jgi:hypothetical protein